MKKLISLAAALIAAPVLALTLAPAASAKPLPVAYQGMQWSYPQVKAHHFNLGQGEGPYVTLTHWSHWNARSAYSLGALYLLSAAGYPHYKEYAVGVTLSVPRTHHGKVYFARMVWSYHKGGKHYVEVYYYANYGGVAVWA
jgi:hypothetical protein